MPSATVPIENADLETVSLSTDSRFFALIERSRGLCRPGTGIPLRELRRKYGLELQSKAKPRARNEVRSGSRSARSS